MSKGISDSTRRSWNAMLLKLLIGKTVTLDNRDAAWLLEVGAGAVAYHGEYGEVVTLASTESPKPKRNKKSVDNAKR